MNAAHLPLMAGVLAVLAIGVLGAAPGLSVAPGAAAPSAPSCPLHLSVNVPAQVPLGGPIPLSAVVTTHAGCTLTVSEFSFIGVPGGSGTVTTTNGVVMAFPENVGTYPITVIATTNLGSIGGTATMQVV